MLLTPLNIENVILTPKYLMRFFTRNLYFSFVYAHKKQQSIINSLFILLHD